jgi:hypothetical protein
VFEIEVGDTVIVIVFFALVSGAGGRASGERHFEAEGVLIASDKQHHPPERNDPLQRCLALSKGLMQEQRLIRRSSAVSVILHARPCSVSRAAQRERPGSRHDEAVD